MMSKSTLYFIFSSLVIFIALTLGMSEIITNMEFIEKEEIKECEIFDDKTIFLAEGEKYLVEEGFVSEDESIVIVENNVIKGVKKGFTHVSKECASYKIVVTDMITAPYISETKDLMPCGTYSVTDNEFMDLVLKTKVMDVGYGTRAGAVEAGRFLLLQFPYHMKYFSENGRLSDGTCDGEGRYYHEGLYLNEYKVDKENLHPIVNGPAPWGCTIYANPAAMNQYNSLDCSGFVTWCLRNGGLDPGDIGAGPGEKFDCADLGENIKITDESLQKVKVGDLFAENGHISILIGKENGTFYIAESNSGIDIRVRVTNAEELKQSAFYAIIDMDEFYNHQDGKLTDMWLY